MPVPKYDELMKPLLVAVKDGMVYKIKDAAANLAEQLHLTAEDLAEVLPSGRQTVFKNRVGWAKTYLKKAGLLDSPARATVVITDAGKKVLEENPEKIDSKYLERFPSFIDFTTATDLTAMDFLLQQRSSHIRRRSMRTRITLFSLMERDLPI